MRTPPSPISCGSSATMSSRAAAECLKSDESSLFAIRSIAGTQPSTGSERVRLGVAVPSSASSIIEWGTLHDPLLVPAPSPPPAVAPNSSNTTGWWMVGGLAAAVVGLAAFILTSTPPTVVVRTSTAPAQATLASATAASSPMEELVTEVAPPAEPAPEVTAPAPASAIVAAVAQPVPPAPPPRTTKTKTKRTKSKRPASKTVSKPTATKPAAASSKPTANSGSLPAVECVLDPSACAVPKSGKPTTIPDEPSKALAEKPSAAQLRNALAVVKPSAKQCGRKHGVAAGTSVRVKLSIAGTTGRITQTTVLGDHASTALAACLSTAVKKASFPRFTKPSIGTLYTFRL